MICQCMIDTHLDNYSQVKSHEGKKVLSKKYYHTKCFLERIMVKVEGKNLMAAAKNMLMRANGKMEEVGI